ncbi:hypothetical protein MMC22_008598 [Lobaria immixta]|nr:hypothetical protein [Lobaria immixta]
MSALVSSSNMTSLQLPTPEENRKARSARKNKARRTRKSNEAKLAREEAKLAESAKLNVPTPSSYWDSSDSDAVMPGMDTSMLSPKTACVESTSSSLLHTPTLELDNVSTSPSSPAPLPLHNSAHVSINRYVPPAATWILFAGERIYELCKSSVSSDDGAPATVPVDEWLWGEGRSYSLERWALWKKRFGDVAMTQGLQDDVKDLAGRAMFKMGKVESQKEVMAASMEAL